MKYKLGEICEIVSGSTPKTNIDEYWDGTLKWITPAEIADDSYIIEDSVRKITELGVKKTGLTSFPTGTVILSSRAPIGKVAIAGCEMYCNQGFKNLICSDKINNRYLYWFLKGNTRYLNSLGRGATFKEISKGIISEIVINVPDIISQEKAANNLERISQIIKLRKRELEVLDVLIKARFVELFGDPVNNSKSFIKEELGSVCTK
ncbi:MAG: restriction endonuclease subunit S, partial [Lachnospiraceae bacterium]|nr:restriction endonuclease subunit S [Lachnospiraceae bacterium]